MSKKKFINTQGKILTGLKKAQIHRSLNKINDPRYNKKTKPMNFYFLEHPVGECSKLALSIAILLLLAQIAEAQHRTTIIQHTGTGLNRVKASITDSFVFDAASVAKLTYETSESKQQIADGNYTTSLSGLTNPKIVYMSGKNTTVSAERIEEYHITEINPTHDETSRNNHRLFATDIQKPLFTWPSGRGKETILQAERVESLSHIKKGKTCDTDRREMDKQIKQYRSITTNGCPRHSGGFGINNVYPKDMNGPICSAICSDATGQVKDCSWEKGDWNDTLKCS